MFEWLTYLNTFKNTYPIEFIILILALLYSFFRTLNDFLPTEYKLNKKIAFWRNVKQTICKLTVSLQINKEITQKELREFLKDYWNKNTKVIQEKPLIFQSLSTGAFYEIQLGESEIEGKSDIIIKNTQGFRTGRFGKLHNLQNNLDEIQELINKFISLRSIIEKINTEIKINPRKFNVDTKGIIINERTKDFSYTCNAEMIQVITKGIPKIKKIVIEALNKWIEHFI